jgi:hypothetical protein
MTKPTYTVAVGTWAHTDGYPSPDRTCGHAHRTPEAAERCGDKLYAAKTINGNWQACAAWHNWYVLGTHEEHMAQVERERLAWNEAAVRLGTHPY